MPVNKGTARHAFGSLLLSIILALPAAWAGPMDLGGQFAVSQNGAATYNIPIQAAPGIAGMEPRLALSYSSQTGNGLLGMGWSLSGLSAITRCGQTVAQDGSKGGVSYGANDRFCLDGQRLVKANVSDIYGAPGIEYRTERESFSKIVSQGGSLGDPDSFRVQTKAGQIIEYGATTDSRIEAQGRTQARIWAINKISDTTGNNLKFTYQEEASNTDYWPTRIVYTGRNGADGPNSMRFGYEDRPDSIAGYATGSLFNTTRRMTRIQSFTGETLIKEYRLNYAPNSASNRSRISAITECAMPDNICKPPLIPAWTDFGSNSFNAGSSWTALIASFLVDVNGDGLTDMVAQQSDGLYVALGTETGVGGSTRWIDAFGSSQGYADQNVTPLLLLDVNGDGLADVVGIAGDGVHVALSTGTGFAPATVWLSDFGTTGGWSNMDTYPRTFADVDGDGRPDLVGFKNDGVYVALNTGAAFALEPGKWSTDFGSASTVAYATQANNPRLLQDMNGDGLPDLVGFASGGVYVGLNTKTGFAAVSAPMLADFGVNAGWTTQDTYPRTLADVNGDGLADIVGFKNDGVHVSLNTGVGLLGRSLWLADFGTGTTTAYGSQKGFPRYVLDVNGDGRSDIVGFAANGVQVSLGTGNGFNTSSQWVAGFGSAAGYTAGMPRQVADMDADGFPDVVGTLASGASVALSGRAMPPDLITAFASGLGLNTTLSYAPLTKPWVYTKGSGAIYPQMDLTVPLYVVSFVRSPNGLGSGYALSYYQYGSFKVDLSGRGALGFGWQQQFQTDSNITLRTAYSQDWPYQGLPTSTTKTLPGSGNEGLLSLTVNSYACQIPQTQTACAVAAGNRYFPYVQQTTEAAWEIDHTALPIVATTNKYEDGYGNATEVKVVAATANDSVTKTTTNTYENFVTPPTTWLLGRLIRSTVVADATGTSPPGMTNGTYVFNDTVSADEMNYNLRAKAIANGWDQTAPLKATVTIDTGVTIGSSSADTPAFNTGTSFPGGTTLTLINNGNIYGGGGKGGQGGKGGIVSGSVATEGGIGGVALNAAYRLTVANNGTVAGGGGGGGGGGGVYVNSGGSGGTAGSGGGGGAGKGAGGLGGTTSGNGWNINGNPGIAGTASAGGAGGAPYNYASYIGGAGGAGGGLGQNGAAGAQGSVPGYNPPYNGLSSSPTIGGAAGSAVTNDSNITWTATGTRLGAVVAGSADAPLALTAISPTTGALAGGTPVILTGTGFTVGTTVKIGDIDAVACSVTNSTRMTCLTPANTAGAKDVTVSVAGGTPTSDQTLAGGFTYQTLTVTSIAANVGSVAGGLNVTITGDGFAPGAIVSFGGVVAPVCTVVNATTLSCITPANSAGVKDVTVGVNDTTATLAGGFSYQTLTLTAVTPNQGGTAGGTVVVLTGSSFAAGAVVTIGGVPATDCVAPSMAVMTCTTPTSNTVGAKDVTISLGGASVTLAGGFTYVEAFSFASVLSSNTQNYNLRTAAIGAGWNQVKPLQATVTINAGVVVSSSSAATAAFDTGSNFPGGTTLALINNGAINGAGGVGGQGGKGGIVSGSVSTAGGVGGAALNALYRITVTNNGTVAGGGGGGGGGGGVYINSGGSGGTAGSGGGGGAGQGAGGLGGTTSGNGWNYNGYPGTAGTALAGGAGGASYNYASYIGGAGGAGGGLGQDGTAGAQGSVPGYNPPYNGYSSSPMPGGAAGAAAVGNANITWATEGTRLGPLVAAGSGTPLTVTAINPSAGTMAGGTLVTISGTGFVTGASVSIGGVAALACTVSSSSQMSCFTPANSAGAKNVVVSSGGSNATLANGYTYESLTVTAISPNIGSFVGGTAVTVTGTGFAPGAGLSFNGTQSAACTVVSATSMTCTTPAHSASTTNVTVGLNGTTTTLAAGFSFQGLSLTALTPNQGNIAGGTVVTLTGTGFAAGAGVTIDGVAATGCSVASLTSMSCTTPAGTAGAKDVVVSLRGSTVTRTAAFAYVNEFQFSPVISSNTQNYNLRAAAIAAGWNQTAKLVAAARINTSVIVSSSSTAIAAFDTGGGYPSGSTVTLTNYGTIMGAGGVGGNGGGSTTTSLTPGLAGGVGGLALQVSYPAAITNYGTIGGGGGGGGGGAPGVGNTTVCGGGGGGGGGGAGSGGLGGSVVPYSVGGVTISGLSQGNDGNTSTGSSGVPGGAGTFRCGGGGRGGNLGSAGQPGSASTSQILKGTPGVGGAAGAAVNGNSNVTWTVIGLRKGALQ
jgi:hypothetical protein